MRHLACLNFLALPLLLLAFAKPGLPLAWLWLIWTWSLIFNYHLACIRLSASVKEKKPAYLSIVFLATIGALLLVLQRPDLILFFSLALFFISRFLAFHLLAHACGLPWHTHLYHFVPVIGMGLVAGLATQAVTQRFPSKTSWFLPLLLCDFLALPLFAAEHLDENHAAPPETPQAKPPAKTANPPTDNPYAAYRRKS
ncbi:MAG: hypothetical protein RL095_3196 [Verrucomicrobiota bacterium]|jgi:hypothetical protein